MLDSYRRIEKILDTRDWNVKHNQGAELSDWRTPPSVTTIRSLQGEKSQKRKKTELRYAPWQVAIFSQEST